MKDEIFGESWRANAIRHTKEELLTIFVSAILEKNEQIAALTIDRDTAMSMLEDSEACVSRLCEKAINNNSLIRASKEIESVWMDMVSGREKSIAMDRAANNVRSAIGCLKRG